MVEIRDIKKMSRRDLLEILVMQSKRIDELEVELNKTNELLNDRQIMISEVGSIADASLKLNKVFEVAQKAADQYLNNIERIEKKQESIKLKLEKEYNKIKASKVKEKQKKENLSKVTKTKKSKEADITKETKKKKVSSSKNDNKES